MKTDNDPRTTEEIRKEVERLMVQHAQYLFMGLGERSATMTDATVALFGTSGRGSTKAVRIIETLAKTGYVTIVGTKRRRVCLTAKGLACGLPE